MTLRKNVAGQKLVFSLINATTGAALAGATVTAKISLDGGSSTTATGAVAELANGQYVWSPDAADTNAAVVGVQFTATNAVPRSFTVYTWAINPGLTEVPATVAGAVGSVTGAVGSVTTPVTLHADYDAAKTAATQASVDLKASQASVDAANAILGSGTHGNAALKTLIDAVGTLAVAINAKTTNLPGDPADQSAVEAAITAAQGALTTLINAVPAAVGAGEPLTGYSRDRLLRIAAATSGGDFSGPAAGEAGTATLKEVGVGGATLVVAEVDADGNRDITSVGA